LPLEALSKFSLRKPVGRSDQEIGKKLPRKPCDYWKRRRGGENKDLAKLRSS
jgi:hypothetical protein